MSSDLRRYNAAIRTCHLDPSCSERHPRDVGENRSPRRKRRRSRTVRHLLSGGVASAAVSFLPVVFVYAMAPSERSGLQLDIKLALCGVMWALFATGVYVTWGIRTSLAKRSIIILCFGLFSAAVVAFGFWNIRPSQRTLAEYKQWTN